MADDRGGFGAPGPKWPVHGHLGLGLGGRGPTGLAPKDLGGSGALGAGAPMEATLGAMAPWAHAPWAHAPWVQTLVATPPKGKYSCRNLKKQRSTTKYLSSRDGRGGDEGSAAPGSPGALWFCGPQTPCEWVCTGMEKVLELPSVKTEVEMERIHFH